MPEKTGTVTGFIKKRDGTPFGLNIDGSEMLYSFPEYRGEPFDEDLVEVGCEVRVEYQETEKAGKSKTYISVLEVLGGTHGEPASAMTGQVSQSEWGFEQKDKIGLMQTCLNVYGDMWTAALNAGSASKVPEPTTIASSARALWEQALEAID